VNPTARRTHVPLPGNLVDYPVGMTGWRLSSVDWALWISSRVMDAGSAVTPRTGDHAVTSFVGEACATSLSETGNTSTSRRPDAKSGGEGIRDRSEDLSAREWSGRKRRAPAAQWCHLPAMHRRTLARQQVLGLPADTADSPSSSSSHRDAVTKHRCCHGPGLGNVGW